MNKELSLKLPYVPFKDGKYRWNIDYSDYSEYFQLDGPLLRLEKKKLFGWKLLQSREILDPNNIKYIVELAKSLIDDEVNERQKEEDDIIGTYDANVPKL